MARFPGRKTIRRVIVLAITLIAFCPLVRIYFDIGGLRFCSILKWGFSTPVDREKTAFPKDIVVAFIFICRPYGGSPVDLNTVLTELADLASDHTDSDSVHLKMTFALHSLYSDSVEFSILSQWCGDQSSELELLLPCEVLKGRLFREALHRSVKRLNSLGWARTIDAEIRLAVVRERCENEHEWISLQRQIRALKDIGCYADMSFPDIGIRDQPVRINTICYMSSVASDPFVDRMALRTGEVGIGDLVVIDGPLLIDWTDWRHRFGPLVEDGRLTPMNPPDPCRAGSWIRANVHVIGQPNWIFAKLKIAEVSNVASVRKFREWLDRTLTYLETMYRDNEAYRLHYVTAREMYNISKAAEAGRTGDAGAFRNYIIAPYEATDLER